MEDALSVILDFDPAVDPVGTKPIVKKQPKARIQTSESIMKKTEEDISPIENDGQRRTPARSRAPSLASGFASPVRPNYIAIKQEPTPNYYSENLIHNLEIPSTLSQRLFDEENTQRDFFDSVYARRYRHEQIEPEQHETVPIDYSRLTVEQRRKAIMLHLYIEQDSPESTAKFVDLIRDPKYPENIMADFLLDDENNTLLHMAASYGRIELVRLLISKGVKINVTCKNDVTPLMRAIQISTNLTTSTMNELLSLLGPSIFATDAFGSTCLHYAAKLSQFRSKRKLSTCYMGCLLKYIQETKVATNSDVGLDSVDQNGDSAFILACRYRNHKAALLLFNQGASKTLENKQKESAASIAQYDYRLLKMMVIYY